MTKPEFLRAAIIPTLLIAVAAAAAFMAPERGLNWTRMLNLLLISPGAVFAVIVAVLLSPQGIHGDEFMWLAWPASWFFYFGLVCWIRRLRRGKVTV